MNCTEECWTPVRCPDHGTYMPPRGRSAPMDYWLCCEEYQYDPNVNTCHLWSEHDSTRWYTDPEGWVKHETECTICQEEQ